jgi:hypothetical protein
MMVRWWPEPTAGDIVWCHFPDNINPRPKPRPALILVVLDDDAPEFTVRVAYGTSQRTTTLYRGEFAILRDKNRAAYEEANLSFDTKFNLRQSSSCHFPRTGSRYRPQRHTVKFQNSARCIHPWFEPCRLLIRRHPVSC